MRLVVALLVALVLAVPAGGRSTAEPPAELFVFPFDTTPGAAAETDVDLSLPGSANAVTDYVPTGYTVALTRPPGTAIGETTILVSGRTDPISAGLFTADPAAFTADSCAPGLHAAIWTAELDTFPLTIFVDPTSVDETARGAYNLVYCLPPAADARVIDVDLDIRNVLTSPATAGVVTWRAFVTPVAGSAFEVRSIVAFPQTLGLKPSFAANVLTLRGRLVSAGLPRPGVNVHLAFAARADLSDARDLGVARTRTDGSYSLKTTRTRTRTRTTQRLTLIAYVNFYVGACSDPPLLPGGCAEQSIAPPPARFVSLAIPGRRQPSRPDERRRSGRTGSGHFCLSRQTGRILCPWACSGGSVSCCRRLQSPPRTLRPRKKPSESRIKNSMFV